MILQTPIQKFDGAAIPQALRALPRWAPWAAVWNADRGKFDKLPKSAKRPEHGISTASPEKWFKFAESVTTYEAADGMLHGVGFVLTGIQNEGVIGIDLDNCVDNGVLAPWAAEVVRVVNSYTEISPSGRGIRIFASGKIDGADWNNHAIGIEIYGGSSPRYLTVTGRRVEGTPAGLEPVDTAVMAGLRGSYGRTTAAAVARSDLPPMPPVLDEADTPALADLADLDVPPAARDFFTEGTHGGDRSRTLHSATIALLSAGLTMQETLSFLHHNDHAFEVALGHRGQDADKADTYLWENQCIKAQPKARPRALTALDFDDISGSLEAGASILHLAAGADDFEDVSGGVPQVAKAKPPAKKGRFDIKTASEYIEQTRRTEWLIKGLLPRADVGAVFGASGSGKTFLVLDMVCRLALGMPWFGIPTKPTKVLYIAAEGAGGMRDRVGAWVTHNGRGVDELDGQLFILGDQPNMLEKDDVKDLLACARSTCGRDLGLVVVDTMAQTTPGANENSGEDMGRMLSHVRSMGKALGAMMLLVGHSGKDASRGLRGWSGIRAALDAELETTSLDNYRAVTVTKLKDGAGEGDEYRFKTHSVVVDRTDDNGDRTNDKTEWVTSCVAVVESKVDRKGATDTEAGERNAQAEADAKAKVAADKAVANARATVAKSAKHRMTAAFIKQRTLDGGVPEVAMWAELIDMVKANNEVYKVNNGQHKQEVDRAIPHLVNAKHLEIVDGMWLYTGD